jgi:hypothetical protein
MNALTAEEGKLLNTLMSRAPELIGAFLETYTKDKATNDGKPPNWHSILPHLVQASNNLAADAIFRHLLETPTATSCSLP